MTDYASTVPLTQDEDPGGANPYTSIGTTLLGFLIASSLIVAPVVAITITGHNADTATPASVKQL